jgi:hypothetical protein
MKSELKALAQQNGELIAEISKILDWGDELKTKLRGLSQRAN